MTQITEPNNGLAPSQIAPRYQREKAAQFEGTVSWPSIVWQWLLYSVKLLTLQVRLKFSAKKGPNTLTNPSNNYMCGQRMYDCQLQMNEENILNIEQNSANGCKIIRWNLCINAIEIIFLIRSSEDFFLFWRWFLFCNRNFETTKTNVETKINELGAIIQTAINETEPVFCEMHENFLAEGNP